MAKKSRGIPEINAGSMADIAFLLLVFFLVTTTMDTPTGITVTLPPDVEQPQVDLNKRNVLEVLVNSRNQLLVEGELFEIRNLRAKTVAHLTNDGRDPNLAVDSKKAIVSLKADRGTEYDTYLTIYNELTAAYRQVRDAYSIQKYGVPFNDLDPEREEDKINDVKEKYPKQLSEAEPENKGGEN